MESMISGEVSTYSSQLLDSLNLAGRVSAARRASDSSHQTSLVTYIENLRAIREQNKGLPQNVIDTLPRKTFRRTRSKTELSCSICLIEYENGQKLCQLKTCVHRFHEKCLLIWVKEHTNCPLCRQEITQI